MYLVEAFELPPRGLHSPKALTLTLNRMAVRRFYPVKYLTVLLPASADRRATRELWIVFEHRSWLLRAWRCLYETIRPERDGAETRPPCNPR